MADKDTDLVKAETVVNYSLTFEEVQAFETQPFIRTWYLPGAVILRDQATMSMRDHARVPAGTSGSQ